jgi:hypothetical protein
MRQNGRQTPTAPVDVPGVRQLAQLPPAAVPADAAVRPSAELDESALGSEPMLRVPEAQTPLPEVDQALPLLGMFADVVGRRRARYKIALLKTLQADGAGLRVRFSDSHRWSPSALGVSGTDVSMAMDSLLVSPTRRSR